MVSSASRAPSSRRSVAAAAGPSVVSSPPSTAARTRRSMSAASSRCTPSSVIGPSCPRWRSQPNSTRRAVPTGRRRVGPRAHGEPRPMCTIRDNHRPAGPPGPCQPARRFGTWRRYCGKMLPMSVTIHEVLDELRASALDARDKGDRFRDGIDLSELSAGIATTPLDGDERLTWRTRTMGVSRIWIPLAA